MQVDTFKRETDGMSTTDHWPTPDEIMEAVEVGALLGWCRECGTLRQGVEAHARGDRCIGGECGRDTVDGVTVWLARYVRLHGPG